MTFLRRQLPVAGFSLIFAASALAQGHTLRLNLEEGQQWTITTKNSQKSKQEVYGQQATSDSEQTLVSTAEVVDVDESGNATVKYTYTRVAQTAASMGQPPMAFDSDKPSATPDMTEKIMGSLVGKTFTITFSPRAEIQSVEGMEDIIQGAVDATGMNSPQMTEQMKAQMGDDVLKDTFAAFFPVFPENAVAVGDTWTVKQLVEKPFPMTIDSTYTLKEATGDAYVIGIESKFGENPDAKPMEMMGSKTEMKMTGTQAGSYSVDKDTGFVMKTEVNQDMKGEIVTTMAQMPEPMKIPMEIQGTIGLTAEEGVPAAAAP